MTETVAFSTWVLGHCDGHSLGMSRAFRSSKVIPTCSGFFRPGDWVSAAEWGKLTHLQVICSLKNHLEHLWSLSVLWMFWKFSKFCRGREETFMVQGLHWKWWSCSNLFQPPGNGSSLPNHRPSQDSRLVYVSGAATWGHLCPGHLGLDFVEWTAAQKRVTWVNMVHSQSVHLLKNMTRDVVGILFSWGLHSTPLHSRKALLS